MSFSDVENFADSLQFYLSPVSLTLDEQITKMKPELFCIHCPGRLNNTHVEAYDFVFLLSEIYEKYIDVFILIQGIWRK